MYSLYSEGVACVVFAHLQKDGGLPSGTSGITTAMLENNFEPGSDTLPATIIRIPMAEGIGDTFHTFISALAPGELAIVYFDPQC